MDELRAAIARTLNAKGPADAAAQFYACEYDAKRVKLYGDANAWCAVCTTGRDLFRPVLLIRGEGAALQAAMRTALMSGRQYLLSAPMQARDDVMTVCDVQDAQILALHQMLPGALQPVVNILAQTSTLADGAVRARILARDGTPAAEAGSNWHSRSHADVFVRVAEGARMRGLGKSVLSALCANLQSRALLPLYLAGINNMASLKLAARLGFVDTGVRELTGVVQLRTGA